MPDEVLSGVYANGVMIGHGATEFGLDFLTSFFPQSAVSARVFVASGQVPRLIESLKGAVRQLEQRRSGQAEQPNLPPNVPGQMTSENPMGKKTRGDEPSGDEPAGGNAADGETSDDGPSDDDSKLS